MDFSTITYTKSPQESWESALQALQIYTQERKGPTLVLCQTPFSIPVLRRKVPALNEFPLVPTSYNLDDRRYPALQWPRFAAERMLCRYLTSFEWVRERLRCSRFSQIPLSNLGDDPICTMTDVLFGRLLTHNRHVLWASESGKPDLGGVESDENDIWADENTTPPVVHSSGWRLKVRQHVSVMDAMSLVGA